MAINIKNSIEDFWLSNALVYYQIIDESLIEELLMSNPEEKYLYNILTKNNYLDEIEIRRFVRLALQIPTVTLEKVEPEKEVLALVPEELCRRYNLLGLQMDKTHIAVAFSDPINLEAENEIEYVTRKYIKKYFAPVDKIKQKIDEYYAPDKVINTFVTQNGRNAHIKFAGDTNFDSDSPVVKLVDQIISNAVRKEASDIHIEPKESTVQVRFRIDGILRNELNVPRSFHAALVSRIKIISNLNIAESRKPQDGKAKAFIEDVDIDLRVSVLPTSFGEKIVIRILDKRNAHVSFDKMGIMGYNLEILEKCFQLKQGIVLVTGPTGSGKSTTLYSAINRIRSTTNNILTIEDPIEYLFEGINQVQVNEKAGITFASALRSFLRQDPDVILVGEIRDRETAEISIQAALTGHLVLSTLHTNDTFTSVTRLKDMGIDKFKIAESLGAIIAQRLVRKLCENCKSPVAEKDIDEKVLRFLKQTGNKVSVHKPAGCTKCGFTGYKGRIGVFEILIMDDTLQEMITNDTSIMQMRKTARNRGFKNLFEDAMGLVAQGITDYNEIIRVINPDIADEEPEEPKTQVVDISESDSFRINKAAQDKPAKKTITMNKVSDDKEESVDEKARILVAEDSNTVRKMVINTIKRMTKWETQEAEDGEIALEMIKKDKPDLLILDIMMPNMDGYELLQELKANPELEDIPVLIFSALKTPKSEQKVYELGADGFIVKPIDPERMIEQIKKVLQRKKLVEANRQNSNLNTTRELKLV